MPKQPSDCFTFNYFNYKELGRNENVPEVQESVLSESNFPVWQECFPKGRNAKE